MTVEVLVINETTLATRLRDNHRKRKEFKRLKAGEVWRSSVSGHSRTTALMNSQELWLPAQDLSKINPASIPAWRKEGLTPSHSKLKSY